MDLRLQVTNKQILRLAIPISVSILIPQMNFITNNIFLGRLGERELGAAGITGVYYLIFGAIGFGLNNGLQALMARRAGENRPEEIGKLFSQGIRIALAIAAIGILVTYFVAPFIYRSALKDTDTQHRVLEFLKIRIWGLPFLYIYQMRNALLVGTNQSRYLIAGTLAETITNIFFDIGFIFGKFGFPALGFNGAAVASILAEAIGMIVVYLVIHRKGIGKRFQLTKHFRFDKVNTRLILVQSSPLIFQHAISIISWEYFFVLIERNQHTPFDLAISNTMRNIFGIFGVFTWSFAATCNTMVSNIIGQGQSDKVIQLIQKIVRISTGIALGACLILNVFPSTILAIYGQGEEFIKAGLPVLRIVSTALVFMSFSAVWLNAVTGTGNTRINLAIEFITIVIYCVYIYFVLEEWQMPIAWGWASEWIYWTFIFTLSYFYINSGRWKGKKI